MKQISAMAAGWTVATLAVSVAVTGCGSDKPSTPSSSAKSSSSSSAAPTSTAPTSSSGAAQPTDYSNLLIKPTDIVVPNDTFKLMQTVPMPNPAGISGLFMNQAGSRSIDDTIYVYPDAEHGFNCDMRASYNAEAAQLARQRTLAFLAQHLRGEAAAPQA